MEEEYNYVDFSFHRDIVRILITPKKKEKYSTDSNGCKMEIRFTISREIMHAMWKPQKFKYIYLLATLYVFTLTLPSASAVYWAFGDELLNHSNAFSLLPKTRFRDAAVILMLIHQVPLFFQ